MNPLTFIQNLMFLNPSIKTKIVQSFMELQLDFLLCSVWSSQSKILSVHTEIFDDLKIIDSLKKALKAAKKWTQGSSLFIKIISFYKIIKNIICLLISNISMKIINWMLQKLFI